MYLLYTNFDTSEFDRQLRFSENMFEIGDYKSFNQKFNLRSEKHSLQRNIRQIGPDKNC